METKQSIPMSRGGGKEEHLGIGSKVLAKNFSTGQAWLPGTISEASGPKSYIVETTDGRLLRRHVNHIRLCHSSLTTAIESTDPDDWSDSVPAYNWLT